MPAPIGRDLEQTRAQLQDWIPAVLPDDATDVNVGPLAGPGATGFSSDTLIFDLSYRSDGMYIERGLVARIHPSGFQLFPEYDLPAQFGVMKALWDTRVPVPEMLYEQRTGDVIGQPFYLMGRVPGQCPADNPPYTAEGWVKELSEADQRSMWDGYVDILVEIHALDPAKLGLDFLAKPELGPTPLDQELAYYENFYRWTSDGDVHPYVEAGLEWLGANKPPQPETPSLVWGDARVGNMIFHGPKCVAVIDWEMARLGDPMMDLAWGLFLSRYHTEGNGIPNLPGFRDREDTIAYYEQKSGRSAEHVAYYEILAGMRFSVILIALGKQLKHYEALPKEVNFEVDNPVSLLHRKQLETLGVL
ncbi:MAG: phosphotransferase family protein [Myxococcota bacterium]|jgi:aminoglycoside phosphotransferase (APT) family kinase protein|nr:phosphotransferase family protein [Myxococcota bacterium]